MYLYLQNISQNSHFMFFAKNQNVYTLQKFYHYPECLTFKHTSKTNSLFYKLISIPDGDLPCSFAVES